VCDMGGGSGLNRGSLEMEKLLPDVLLQHVEGLRSKVRITSSPTPPGPV